MAAAAPRLRRGAGTPVIGEVPYFAEQAEKYLEGVKHMVLVGGAKPPVTFFAYPGRRSALTPTGCQSHVLATESEAAAEALEDFAEILGAGELRVVNACRLPAAP